MLPETIKKIETPGSLTIDNNWEHLKPFPKNGLLH